MSRLTTLFSVVRRTVCMAAGGMAKGKFFYAVRKGAKPGVYKSWDECKSQVDKFPHAIFKKFASEKDAWAFVRGASLSAPLQVINDAAGGEAVEALLPKRGPEPLEYIPLGQKRCRSEMKAELPAKRVKCAEEEESHSSRSSSPNTDGFTYMGDAVVVYTDGCCSKNGCQGARAGIGVYWGQNHPMNVAERLQGRQTNQRAEIQAACRALEQAKKMNVKKLLLYTDSKFTINGVTKWVKTWKTNGWRLTSGGPVINQEDFVKLDELNAELEVVWMHIPGHAGYTGNEAADWLSRQGAAKPLP
ncbi:ribonuclease H1 isoform X1 [Lampris incognitus]|uniref:ribonuclease H1 isoform X1 n=1 Tax=Lampris incognitus TaxID=2546036 RepID=UPI0024B59DC2|nr:ribonuclease H1 isoform X1 [Lampris incognitus]